MAIFNHGLATMVLIVFALGSINGLEIDPPPNSCEHDGWELKYLDNQTIGRVKSWQECGNICLNVFDEQEQKCYYWNFNKTDRGCELHHYTWSKNDDVISGRVNDTGCTLNTSHQNLNYLKIKDPSPCHNKPGERMTSHDQVVSHVTTHQKCTQVCRKVDECKAWSYDKKKKTCGLISFGIDPKKDPNITSGIKECDSQLADVICPTLNVLGATYANCNGRYKVTSVRVDWAPERPVFKHLTMDRYIFWNAGGIGWSIGAIGAILATGGYFHHQKYSGLDTKEPWEGQWNGVVRVECIGRPGHDLPGQRILKG